MNSTRAALRGLFVLGLLLLGSFAARVPAQAGSDELAVRRELAQGLAEALDPARWEEALELLGDSDATTRRAVVEYLEGVELSTPERRAQRVERLATSAASDASATVRSASRDALGELASPVACQALLELAEELPAPERVAAARLLAQTAYPRSSAARELLEAAVLSSASQGGAKIADDVLAVLLPTYGKRLAERDGGGDLARERAPIVLGSRHPSPAVRAAAGRALELFLGRLRELERFERAGRALDRFAADGVPTRPLAFLRVLGDLGDGGADVQEILAGARRLGNSGAGQDEFVEGRWRARSSLVEALAQIAFDELDQAEVLLRQAGDRYDGLIARRVDRSGEVGAALQRELYHERALVEFSEVFRRLASGAAGDDPALLHRLRGAHALQLTAQLMSRRADLPSMNAPDPFFDGALSPYRLVFALRPHAAWPPARQISLQLQMGRALASISAREMPGYEPFPELLPELADPVLDPRRARLLNQLAAAEIEALVRELEQLRLRQLREIDADPALESEIALVSFSLRRASSDLRDLDLAERFYDLRRPSANALNLAEILRREGRVAECRVLATRLYDDLEAQELRQQFSWAVHLSAQTQLVIGGSWSDEDDPARAQEHMRRALELLEGLRTHFEERRALDMARAVDDEIAEALVSMAVNANVKAGDPDLALGYFERAYELRQDDFMRIMLACYRARSGKDAEARELLEQVPSSPRGYYNLACTWSLLGETQLALEYLERDFVENRQSFAALEKQKEWARGDPDLASLRDDPRFEALTDPAPAPAEEK